MVEEVVSGRENEKEERIFFVKKENMTFARL